MSAKVTLVIQGIHMGLGHEGIKALLKRKGFDVKNLEPGSLIMCLNTKGDKLKVLGSYGLVLGYLRMPNGQRIYKEALQYLPATFGASGFDYSKAVRRALEKRIYQEKPRGQIGPLQAAKALREARHAN